MSAGETALRGLTGAHAADLEIIRQDPIGYILYSLRKIKDGHKKTISICLTVGWAFSQIKADDPQLVKFSKLIQNTFPDDAKEPHA